MEIVSLKQLQQMSEEQLSDRSLNATIRGAELDLFYLGLRAVHRDVLSEVIDETNWDSYLQKEWDLNPKMAKYAVALLVFLKEEGKIKK